MVDACLRSRDGECGTAKTARSVMESGDSETMASTCLGAYFDGNATIIGWIKQHRIRVRTQQPRKISVETIFSVRIAPSVDKCVSIAARVLIASKIPLGGGCDCEGNKRQYDAPMHRSNCKEVKTEIRAIRRESVKQLLRVVRRRDRQMMWYLILLSLFT